MTLDKKLALGGASNYESPLVTALDIRSEGVLCGRYGEANKAGTELNESNIWDF